MPTDYQQFPQVNQNIVNALKKQFPIKLSRKEDTEFDRGDAWGVQRVIGFLQTVVDKQDADTNDK